MGPASKDRLFVVVSGLPASGKTTLAKQLAPELRLPLIDKDGILETLFDALGVKDLAWRQTLSRASDSVLRTLTESSCGAVLTSFWRHRGLGGDSGTPLEWLEVLSHRVVEIHCTCPTPVAVRRFTNRRRHKGHCDDERREKLTMQFEAMAARGALGVGSLFVVDTTKQVDVTVLAKQISTDP